MIFEPYMCIRVFTRADIGAMCAPILAALVQDSELAPQKFGLDEPFNVELENVPRLWQAEASQPFGTLDGERKRPFRVGFHVFFGKTSKRPFHTIYWETDPVALRRVGAGRIEALFLRLVAIADPHWAACYHSDDFERQNVFLNYRDRKGVVEPYRIVGVHPHKVVPGLYWLNYLGPELSASLPGLASASTACGATPLGKGTFLKLADDPLHMVLPETVQRVDRCKQALGEHRFSDRNHPLPEDEPLELDPPRLRR